MRSDFFLLLIAITATAQYCTKELIGSGTNLKRLAGIRHTGWGNSFYVCDTGEGAIKLIRSNGRVIKDIIPYNDIYNGTLYWGLADDIAVNPINRDMSLSTLFAGKVPTYDKTWFHKYSDPIMMNSGPPIFPFFASQLGFVNPIAYDNTGNLYAANGGTFGGFLSNGIFKLTSDYDPIVYNMYDVVSASYNTFMSVNAFDFGPNGKLYAPGNNGVLEIDLVNVTNEFRAEYVMLFDGLVNPISVRVNNQGLVVVLDRDTGYVWTYDLMNPSAIQSHLATLEPGLDNFDFYGFNKILVTANRNRIWSVNLRSGYVRVKLASPVAFPQTIDVRNEKMYIADNYAIVVVCLNTGNVLNTLTPYNTPSLSAITYINTLHVTDSKLYVADGRSGTVAVLDINTLNLLEFFGGHAPNQTALGTITYVLEDNNNNLLVADASGGIVQVTRQGYQQVNNDIVTNIATPYGLARNGSTLYITDLGTTDTNGGLYSYDLASSSTIATLILGNLSHPKGVSVKDNDILVVETSASRINFINLNGTSYQIDDLDIIHMPSEPGPFSSKPIGLGSDVAVADNGIIYYGTNGYEGSVKYFA